MPSRPYSFVLALALVACASSPRPDGPGAPAPQSTAPRDLTADQQVLQALNRVAFGPRPGDVERVRAMGVDRWIDQQLHPERIADANIDALVARYPVLAKSGADLLRDYPPAAQVIAQAARANGGRDQLTAADSMKFREAARESYRIVGELQTTKVARAVASERQLQEVMTDFWANHFNVFAGKDRIRYHLPAYDAMLRAHALGKFRDLLGAVATSDAMLQYLDNFQSIADSTRPTLGRRPRQLTAAQQARFPRLAQAAARRPKGLNENYARELMELHTLGVDGGYTQQDVIEVARALTGWSIRPPAQGGGFVFRPEVHDAAAKVVLGHQLAAGRGIEDGQDVLDIVARHPATAHFIAYKLARRFVADTPSKALVDRAAQTFTRTDGDIRETLRTILTSPEFFSQTAYRSKVKSPFELVVSAARALGAAADTTPRTAQLIARLGQPIFGHPDPNGWPETGDAWMNTGAILNRINFGTLVAANRLPGARLADWPTAAKLHGAPRDQQVDGVVAALFGGAISPDTRAVLVSGENPLLASAQARGTATDSLDTDSSATMMTAAPNERRVEARTERRERDPALAGRTAARPARAQPAAIGKLPPLTGLAQIVGLALGAPEFQRR